MEASPALSVTIADNALRCRVDDVVAMLVRHRAASRLAAADASLWGEAAMAEARQRLGWLRLPATSRPLLAEIDRLREGLATDGIEHIILAGMGGSSLAPEVICAQAGVPLSVLDTTDPQQTRRVLEGDLARSLLIVASKSGGTVETDSQRRIFTEAFAAAGCDPAAHLLAITDPGSPLATLAEEQSWRAVILADPQVGGRFAALSAFGLVPAGLAGVAPGRLLDEAAAVTDLLARDAEDNPAIRLAAAMAASHAAGREKLVLAESPALAGFGAWAEQLIAERSGKRGRGMRPLTGEGGDCAELGRGAAALHLSRGPLEGGAVRVDGALGAQFLLWECAVALLGHCLDLNPFDQPDVEAAKQAARACLEPADSVPARPAAIFGPVEVYATLPEADMASLSAVLHGFCRQVPAEGYLAIQAFLDREAEAQAPQLRRALARLSQRPTSFGWGPRFLHSTGQYHKGGHPNGAFVQITGAGVRDLAVPGRTYQLGELQRAQAAGDAAVLRQRGRPVLHLHLRERGAGLADLLAAATAA